MRNKILTFVLVYFWVVGVCQTNTSDPVLVKEWELLMDKAKIYQNETKDLLAKNTYLKALKFTKNNFQKHSYEYLQTNTSLAYQCELMNNTTKAEYYYIEAKKNCLNELKEISILYAIILQKLGRLYNKQDLFQKAESLLVESNNLYNIIFGENSEEYDYSCNILAVFYYKYSYYNKTEELYIKNKNIREKLYGVHSKQYANALNNLGDLYRLQGLFNEAETLLIQTKDIRKEIHGIIHPDYALALNNLGVLYSDQGFFKRAERSYLEATKTYKNTVGINHPDYANALNNLAQLYHEGGIYYKAEPLYKQCLNIYIKTYNKQHPNYTIFLNNLAELYKSQGFLKKAETLHIEVKNIRQNTLGINHPDYAVSLNNLATLYSKLGLYQKAEQLFFECLKIDKNKFGKNHSNYASDLSNLSVLYRNIGFYQKAIQLNIEAKNIRQNTLGINHPDYATSVNNLASLYEVIGLYSKAEPFYIEAKNIYKKTLGIEHPGYTTCLNNLAGLYRKKELYKKAEDLHLEVIKIRKHTTGTLHTDYALALNNLALLYYEQHLYIKAEPLNIESIKIYKYKFGLNHPLYLTSCLNIASLYQKTKQYKKADKNYLEVLNDFNYNFHHNFIGHSNADKRKVLEQQNNTLNVITDYILELLQKNIEADNKLLEAYYNTSLLVKGYLLNDAQKTKQLIAQSNNQSLIDNLDRLQFFKNKLANASSNTIDSLGYKIEKLEKSISYVLDSMGLLNKQDVSIQSIAKTLQSNEVFVDIKKVNDNEVNYIAFITTTKSELPTLVTIQDSTLDSEQFQYYKNSIYTKLEDTLSYQKYFETILAKVKELNPNTTTIYFSPDGVYNKINLNTLLTPNGDYLFEQFTINTVTSARSLLKSKKSSSHKSSALFGRPTYHLQDNDYQELAFAQQDNLESLSYARGVASINGNTTFSDLPATEKEVKTIETLLKKNNYTTSSFIKENATEEAIKHLHNPKIVHIATHGYFSPSESTTEAEAMLSSSLILAGVENYAQSQEKPNLEDGVLTAYEVSALALDSTDLVILSACETGRGFNADGQGVYGLQRGFIVAGAKVVIMSLWKVDDEATKDFMIKLYSEYLSSNNIDDAFKKTQLYIKQKHKSPYYWGAFVMVKGYKG